ncbi:MAG: glutathione S-transferase family protein [Gammaproteobacteria bacterium]
MKLFDWAPAPNPRRVRIFLLEKEIEIPIVDVAGENFQLSSAYKQRYPEAMVPMLELDDGTQIGEAMAICRYLESLYPSNPLMGKNPVDAANIDMWERRAWEQGMMPCSDVFRNTVPEFADRSLAGRHVPLPQISELVDRGKRNMTLFFDKLNQRLEGREFIASDCYTVADITALTVIDFAKMADLELAAEYTNLLRWYEQVSSRPSAKLSKLRTDGKPNLLGE